MMGFLIHYLNLFTDSPTKHLSVLAKSKDLFDKALSMSE